MAATLTQTATVSTTITLAGTATLPGSSLASVVINNADHSQTQIGTVTVGTDGNWSMPPVSVTPLAPGSYTVTTVQTYTNQVSTTV